MNWRKELTETILPFWLNHALDTENGGIFTCLDERGEIYGPDKSVWFQGRALWAFSKAYNLIDRNPAYLRAADRIYGFLNQCTDTDGRMFFTVTADGRGIQKRRYYFSETFAAIGCAEYAKATGRPEALRDAEAYFRVAYDCFTGARPTAPKLNPETAPLKSLSPVMIMLSTARVMSSLNTENRDFYNKVAADCLQEILHGGYLTDRALHEHISTDGQTVDSPTGRIVNPGHSLEAAWFVLSEGLLTGNDEALQTGRRIIDLTLPLGIDRKNGGIIAFCDAEGRPPVQLEWDMKLWWPQCEAIIALRLAYTLFGDERYRQIGRELEDYCERHFIDRRHGEWYGYLHYDNTPSTTLKGNLFKGPFHIPRLYMLMTLLEEEGSVRRFFD